ncbi:MAG: M20/M25/M40 family metallo-hydrolase [Planctomycetes bacterium]|nr:M20/M25/M40 family metallo-hydrolase [Planctomycetota bacterium]
MIDPVALLRDLVAIPSVSGNEAAAAARAAEALRGEGLSPVVSGRNVWCAAGSGGPVLLLNAHLDTVPPTERWTRDPFAPSVEGGRLHGLGAGDDKASVAAMAAAFARMAREGIPGRLVAAFTCDEETGGQGLEVCRGEFPAPDAAVVGEPTGLRVATAQRGLVRIEAVAEGRAAHAARPHQGVNAILLALEDVERLRSLRFDGPPHPLLGHPTVTVTTIRGGAARNVVPAECVFTVDARPTPDHGNDVLVPRLRGLIRSRIATLRDRMTPVETPRSDPLVAAALAATGTADPVGFGGVSDLFHVRDVPGIVLGPGDPEQSHQADESVPLDQVLRAAEVYRDLALRWFAAKGGGP